ncbi:MAG: glycosyltransferase [Muribaculaceae bacterium]|nr:glycosyltransferase [Muribaculaceae bacterium]
MDGSFQISNRRFSYSIAIRTLGTAGEKFRKELESIRSQTVKPDKVIVYIAEGFSRPDYQIGMEQYVWVKKGMMAQRLLPYDEIKSDLILFLDDDVELSPDSVEKMVYAMEAKKFDAIGADIFQNHKMSVRLKLYAAFVNLVIPHLDQKWAFKIRKNGTFSYIQKPNKTVYPSQSCAGPSWMIKKSVYEKLNFLDELWLEKFDYSYGEDQLETYKIYKNGFRLGVCFDSGIVNLNGQTDSKRYKTDNKRLYIKSKANFSIWWRTIFISSNTKSKKYYAILSFAAKSIWTIIPLTIFCFKSLSFKPLYHFFKGNLDAWKFVHTSEFLSLPSYVIPTT